MDTGIEEVSLAMVIADRHANPRETEEHKQVDPAIGLFRLKQKPDVNIDLDDRFDLPGLNTKRGASIMGTAAADPDHDLLDEIRAGEESLNAEWSVVEIDNERHCRNNHPERQYTSLNFAGLGNHTDFLARLGRQHHSMRKLLNVGTVRKIYERKSYVVGEFLQPILIGGVCFRHYHPGKTRLAAPIDRHFALNGMSSVSAHGHEEMVRHYYRADGLRQTCMMVPCSKHPKRLGQGEVSGVTLMRNIRGGQFRYEFVGMEEVLQEYRDHLMSQRRKSDASLQAIVG
ncbi:hypothetical protein [Sulfitobacter dubius]|uniref:hypothetical protein n=1 Tax=Sulfitobacter dubius TaxID=218673 RepID=UPI0022AFFF97|nr:hypothetical protein [Sulfitobacter dubius]MCZ4366609.1 hypothetical protein [Sulfitobacter dubius]